MDQEVSRVKLKKTLNVFSVMSMNVGNMIGSGIFISPKGVLLYTGSVGKCIGSVGECIVSVGECI